MSIIKNYSNDFEWVKKLVALDGWVDGWMDGWVDGRMDGG